MSSHFLTSAVEWLDQRIAQDSGIGPDLFAQLTAAQRDLGLLHGTRPICSFLRPYVLSRARYTAITQAAETLAVAFERLAASALQDEALIAELALTEQEATMARLDPGYSRLCVTSRLDTYLNGADFKFLEYNAESPAGLADQMQLEKILFTLPYMQEFLERYNCWRPQPHRRLLTSLLDAYQDWGGQQERPQIAIVDWEGVSTTPEFNVLQSYFVAEGYPTIIADPRELEYDGEQLSVREFRIDIFYKRVIIHEFLAKYDETHPLARAYADRKVCMVNSFRTKIVHKKASFAILSDPQYEHLFTPEQLTVIREHIPWTRRVRQGRTTFDGVEHDLIELLRRERERFVLKPNDDYGGAGLVLGWETTPEDWESALATALAHPYVAQERAAVEKIKMPMFTDRFERTEMLVDFDPFLFLHKAEGGLVRLSSSSLSNVSSGGGETALLVLEDS